MSHLAGPLDIGQIVPAVQAAFAQIRRPPEPARAEPVVDASTALAQPVAIAVGVLMHRYSLSRHAAFERLQRLAALESRPLQQQAERLLEAVELLSLPAAPRRA